MSVGYKIKILRKKRGITQDTLSKGIVSRSMLSRIESGTAEPSMSTLAAIAAKLDVSPAFLLEKDDNLLPAEEAFYTRKITECASKSLHAECLELFDKAEKSIKRQLCRIYVYSAFNVAYDDFSSGNFSSARSLLLECLDYLDLVIPDIPLATEKNISLMLAIMNSIENLENIHTLAGETPDFSFQPSLFLYLLKLSNENKIKECEILMEFCQLDGYFSSYIKAQNFIKDYKFIDALLLLKSIASKEEVPLFLRLLCYKCLEDCCKLCEDYKGAYETRLLSLELFNKIK